WPRPTVCGYGPETSRILVCLILGPCRIASNLTLQRQSNRWRLQVPLKRHRQQGCSWCMFRLVILTHTALPLVRSGIASGEAASLLTVSGVAHFVEIATEMVRMMARIFMRTGSADDAVEKRRRVAHHEASVVQG